MVYRQVGSRCPTIWLLLAFSESPQRVSGFEARGQLPYLRLAGQIYHVPLGRVRNQRVRWGIHADACEHEVTIGQLGAKLSLLPNAALSSGQQAADVPLVSGHENGARKQAVQYVGQSQPACDA
jgi:hypothetical protein